MIFVLDNYDSFVYNLVQYLGILGQEVHIVRNDETTVEEIESLQPNGLLISPGPCGPAEAGIAVETVRSFAGRIPILGICLGHQVIAHAYGAVVRRAKAPMHGKTSQVRHYGNSLFAGLPNPVTVCRYHSLAVEETSLPSELRPAAWADDTELMAIEHAAYPVFGIQFHPESLYTDFGMQIMQNFLCRVSEFWRSHEGGV